MALLAGCARRDEAGDQITVQTVPKEASPVALAIPAMPDTAAPDASTPDLSAPGASAPAMSTPGMQALPGMAEFVAATPTPKWSPPANWQAMPPNPMRKGTWQAPAPADAKDAQPVEISVNVFQGQLGGLLANVNRWHGQVGLPEDVTDANMADSVKTITMDGRQAQLVSLDGPNGQSLEGVIVSLPDRVWTFHMLGSTATVTAQRAAFRAFLDSVKWQD
jgi:hypothetical protein